MENTVTKKSFLKKWKRQSKPLRIFFILITLAYLVTLIMFTIAVLKLTGIETLIRIIVLVILYLHLLIFTFGGTILLFTNRKKRFIFLLILTTLYSGILGVGVYFIERTYSIIDNVQKKYIDYTSVMISLSGTTEYNKIGIISAKNDPTGYVIPQDMIKENNITGELVEFDDYISMLSEMYDGNIDAMFVTDGYVTMYSSYEKFVNIQTDTKVVYSMTKKMENVDNISYSTKNLTEPFTLLLMGVDSTGDNISSGASFNGDSLMMITFNPKTLNATVFSIPRDTYVPISCRNGVENKINSSAYGGTSCVVKTIEDLTGIKIDYYTKINFTGVVSLVDDLGGIDVDVPIKFCEQDSKRRFGEYLICLDKGYQKLNGEQALALARHRKTLPAGDFQRVQNQQLVVEAMVRELKNIKSADDFYKILDDVANNVDTNMSTSQILSLYNVGKNILFSSLNKTDSLSIEKTYLTGYDLTMYMDATKSYIYTFQYYRNSLQNIIDLMKVNLEIEKPSMIKNFTWDANKPYEKEVTGKKYYNEERRALLPNFIGNTRSYVESWARDHNIKLNVTIETTNRPDGEVLTQNEHVGKLVDNIKELNITVSKHDGSSNTQVPNKPSQNDPSDEESDSKKETLPDFTGMTMTEFNKWKNGLKNISLITESIELSPEDILTLETTDLKPDTIYKQNVPKGTKLEDITTLKVYYYKKDE